MKHTVCLDADIRPVSELGNVKVTSTIESRALTRVSFSNQTLLEISASWSIFPIDDWFFLGGVCYQL